VISPVSGCIPLSPAQLEAVLSCLLRLDIYQAALVTV
jgi:hypothetical protein